MKILVLGAGIAGLATAWYLTESGIEVVVLDHGAAPASETSHANGGHISTDSGKPWTGPHDIKEFFNHPLDRRRPVRISREGFPQFLPWALRAIAGSRPARYRRHCKTLQRLAAYSRECLEQLLHDLQMQVAFDARGTFALYRSARNFARARRYTRQETIGPDELLAREPALANARVRPAGALYYRGDATGDCLAFCEQIAANLKARGVEFRWATKVHALLPPEGNGVSFTLDAGETLGGDGCVIAAGPGAATFLRPLGVHLPIVPLRGYTLTAPLAEGAVAPGRIADAERRLVFARLGNSFRAAGMADFAGTSRTAPAARLAQLEASTRDWYPDMAVPEFWVCLRPITPDGPPILGASGLPGVWLHTGLGPLGWTLACGAARIVADAIIGRTSAIAMDGLTLQRFA